MSYCPQCGQKVKEGVAFCPNCGASLKPEESAKVEQPVKQAQAPAPRPGSREERWEQRRQRREERHRRRAELRERRHEEKIGEKEEEKTEKHEKGEKHEKREPTVAGLLAGGFIIFLLGLVFYLEITGTLPPEEAWPIWWLGVLAVVIVLAAYGARMARRRYPKAR